MTVEVKIGGTPGSPGSVYDTARFPYTMVGLNRAGIFHFELAGIPAGLSAPVEGDYVEIHKGGFLELAGVIREVKHDDQTDVTKVSGYDGLGQVASNEIDARVLYSGDTEETIYLDILSRIGISPTTTPVATDASVILAGATGNVVNRFAVQNENGLRALMLLAFAEGRCVIAEKDEVSLDTEIWVKVVDTSTLTTTHTLRVGTEVLRLHEASDTWEQYDEVVVLGAGDGSERTASNVGGGGSKIKIVDLRGVVDQGVANLISTKLNNAVSTARKVYVAELALDGLAANGIKIGHKATLFDEAGNNLGTFRIHLAETQPDYIDGWHARLVLASNDTPLPNFVDDGGNTPPLKDVETGAEQHQRYDQPSDKATKGGEDKGEADFTFTGVTNAALGTLTTPWPTEVGTPGDFEAALLVIDVLEPTATTDWFVEVKLGQDSTYNDANSYLAFRHWLSSFNPAGTAFATADEVDHREILIPIKRITDAITAIRSVRIQVGCTSGSSTNIRVKARLYMVPAHVHNEIA